MQKLSFQGLAPIRFLQNKIGLTEGQGKNSRTSSAAASQVLQSRQLFTSGCEPKMALPTSPGRTGDLLQDSEAQTATEHAGCLITQGPGKKLRHEAQSVRNKNNRVTLRHSTVSCGYYKCACWCSVTFSIPAMSAKINLSVCFTSNLFLFMVANKKVLTNV